MNNAIETLVNEVTAELQTTSRWSYWKPIVKAARIAHTRLQKAFNNQSRELDIAISFLTSEQLTKFRQKVYPTLHLNRCEDNNE